MQSGAETHAVGAAGTHEMRAWAGALDWDAGGCCTIQNERVYTRCGIALWAHIQGVEWAH
jgi:hypothetical protein